MVRSPGQVEVLLRAKADFVESSALNGAASRANTATVAALLHSRCDPDYPSGETSGFKRGECVKNEMKRYMLSGEFPKGKGNAYNWTKTHRTCTIYF